MRFSRQESNTLLAVFYFCLLIMSIFKPTTFPPEFLQFLEACGVAVSDFMVEIETPIPRFIRYNKMMGDGGMLLGRRELV